LLVGTVGGSGEPRATRAWAADVLDAGCGRIRVLVDADDPVVLGHLAETGAVAVTGADVRTLQSVQVKGSVTATEPPTAADLERAHRHTEAFIAAVYELDHTEPSLLRRLVPRSLVAVEISVREVYDQSPGPGAGARLPDPRP
jgi:hypothetical protein